MDVSVGKKKESPFIVQNLQFYPKPVRYYYYYFFYFYLHKQEVNGIVIFDGLLGS